MSFINDSDRSPLPQLRCARMNPGIGHDEQFHFNIVYFIHFFGCDKDESMENSICYLFIYLFVFLFFLENREDFIQFSKVNGDETTRENP